MNWKQAIQFMEQTPKQYIKIHTFVKLMLTHRVRVTHICISELNIIGLDNGLSPGHSQIIIWTNAVITVQFQLEQLERLHSEIPSAAPWLPVLMIRIRSKVKARQSQSYKYKKIAKKIKFWNFAIKFACDIPSKVAW